MSASPRRTRVVRPERLDRPRTLDRLGERVVICAYAAFSRR